MHIYERAGDIAFRAYRPGSKRTGVVLVHGGMQASHSFDTLARELAADFDVFVPDRRGRGKSGPRGLSYGLATEVEDILGVLRATGARRLFGLSSGAVISLGIAAAHADALDRLALYEPPLTVPGAEPTSWGAAYERELAAGHLGGAMAAALKGTGDRDLMRYIPAFLLARLFDAMMKREVPVPDTVPVRELVPTMANDLAVVREAATRFAELSTPRPRTLLLTGEKSAEMLHVAADALAAKLPNGERNQLLGVGHIAADNRGKPADVAALLRPFFAA
ncbi:MAG TPA: alpha/beta hydrolase [Kofleriaceae bacterium]|jgi:pimeloyl-ACP methyl ester carboxylesterase